MAISRPNTHPNETFAVSIATFDIKGFNYGLNEPVPEGFTLEWTSTNTGAFEVISTSGVEATVQYNVVGVGDLVATLKNGSGVTVATSSLNITVNPTEVVRWEMDPPYSTEE